MRFSSFFLALQGIAASTVAAAHLKTVNWELGWVTASPDGTPLQFVGINGQWPCPQLDVNIGDIVKINVLNSLGTQYSAIHFHGLFQNGTNHMDGPAMVTQCPIPPGEKFVYQFQVNQPGTYWYHAHIGGQYMDGLRGPIVVHDPAAPYTGQIDQEITMTLADLYHDSAPNLVHYYQSPQNVDETGGVEPVPHSLLMNEAQNVKFNIIPGRKYLFHIINMGALATVFLQFDQHDMTIVEVDGVYVQPYKTSQIYLTTAQRYSVIVEAKADNSQNFAVVAQMYSDFFDYFSTPADFNPVVTGYLVYDGAKELPTPFQLTPVAFDDLQLVPVDQMPTLIPDTVIELVASMGPNGKNQMRSTFNGQDYVAQKIPTLYTALSAPADLLNNTAIYGTAVNPYILKYGSVVEVNINNHSPSQHPFHLHAHNFQVIEKTRGGALFPGSDLTNRPASPMRRDVVMVPGDGYAKIRFVADNPGITLFHCHIEWHVEGGLTATFLEALPELVKSKPYIANSHKNACKKTGILMKGNAAGISKKNKWLELAGANTEPPLDNWGALVHAPTKREAAKRQIRRRK